MPTILKQSLCLLLLVCALNLHAQTSGAVDVDKATAVSSSAIDAVQNKYSKLTRMLQKQSDKLLQRMQRKEAKLRAKMMAKDSTAAKALFAQSQQQYQQLEGKLNDTAAVTSQFPLKEYLPGADSMQTALSFLQQQQGKLPDGTARLQQLQGASQQLQQLQGQLQQAADIKAYIRQRQDALKAQLQQMGMAKELTAINKEAYYYQQRLNDVKAAINDPEKREQQIMGAVRSLPAFKNFMQKNSYLSALFGVPDNYGSAQALAGLQTRSQVQSLVAQRMGSAATQAAAGGAAGGGAEGMMQQQIQQAQGQLDQLKDKANKLGTNSGSSDMDMPDFTPNKQKTKSFLQRLEYGFNLQSSGGSKLLPSISELGLSLGYKLSDKATVGVGASYKQGWGKLFNHIKLTGEGIGLRSFVDIKAKGSIWITGGYELNYMQSFNSLTATIRNIDVWQKSGLIGLTKKYKIGKKEGKLQLLWDFLSYSQVPQAQALKFRVGYGL
ncbi:hypothetical protein [Deminuibacter soli]|uniref:Uncharacterized protein n=1 Tax=Deminuibacter soli TaxID=2291815 RepID=A0A3E1NFV4_9BACT|nr:hypothetical protein [Deminuibacter soli]RFM26757.1 hypothetical protein DXN05_17330 [Deminuibacter soli]